MNDTEIRTLFEEALGGDMPPYPTPDEDVSRGRRFRRRRRSRMAVAAAAGVAACTTLFVVLPGSASHHTDAEPLTGTDGGPDGPPRFLLDDHVWTIESVHEEDPHRGAVVYQHDSSEEPAAESFVEINWKRGDTPLGARIDEWDEPEDSYEVAPSSVAGNEARIVALDHGSHHNLIWNQDGYEMFVGAGITTGGEFDELVGAIREVDNETWIAAMPDDYSPVYDNQEAAAAITSQVPVVDALAPGVGEESMYYSVLNHIDPSDEDAFRQEVIYWVACTWVSQWIAAQHPDSPQSVEVADLRAVVDWAGKNDAMTDDVVWDYVREIINGEPDHDAMLTTALEELRCVTGR